ncbi:unnamed protein product [Phyllotreta striolata]|uniref:Calponin-homology (CH) domain-containing protein n=1 Tax=Phyllotreta striolata TaxID=444603 RepID=A0A9N9TAD8_PHYSR|nr:unnamed protein product [Phyllotreta striolata]
MSDNEVTHLKFALSSATTVEPKPERRNQDFLDINHVRIIPSSLWFTGAYDGKKFTEKMQIINTGRSPVFVRISKISSKAFRMKLLPRGKMLSSGMSIIKYVSFQFNKAVAITQALIYVHINEVPVYYPIEVQSAVSFVKITPRMLYFGEIDMGRSSEQLTVALENVGEKIAQFSIDLGRNDLELIIEPTRGIIKPGYSTEVTVELLGSRTGSFLKEFWVKTEPLQRIWITGTFIMPKLTVEHPLSNNFDLIVIDFPKTYYLAQNNRIIVVKNHSSTNSMYCAVAECNKGEFIALDKAMEMDESLKFFRLNPVEGRLLKNHKAVITITFAPFQMKALGNKYYCITFIKIMKVNYRDGVVQKKDIETKTFSGTDPDQYQIADIRKSDESFSTFELKQSESNIRICLYGEIEDVAVELTPSRIYRENLLIGEETKLTFNIKNYSKYLPIAFKHEKIATFKMDPYEGTLEPQASVDVLLLLKPRTMGAFNKKLRISLLYKNRDNDVFNVGTAILSISYNAHYCDDVLHKRTAPTYVMGITSPFISEVGHLVDDVRYNTADITKVPVQAFVDPATMQEVLDEHNHHLIAFPNDMPKWFHPWRNEVPCTTIFKQLPRYVTPMCYDMTYTPSQWQFKKENEKKYNDYLQQRPLKRPAVECNEMTDRCYPQEQSKMLLSYSKTPQCALTFAGGDTEWPKLIPLVPSELMNIEIKPQCVSLGKIAPHIMCNDFFEIKNNNMFPITIKILALSNSLIINGKDRLRIYGNKSEKLYFDCFSFGLGKYYVPVYILINDYHIFDAIVYAEVVPTTVKCKLKEIIISAKDNVGYLELYNPVNCAIDFEWEVQEETYQIMPTSGKIESRKSLYCKIVFTPRIGAVFRTEIYLLSQSGAKQIVRVSNEEVKFALKFSTQAIEMKNLPLNIPVSKQLVIRNESEESVALYVRNPQPIVQIHITPREGLIESKSDIFFKVTAHFQTIKTFSCLLEFVLQDGREYSIQVYGNVLYPNLIIEPEIMHIRKIPPMAYQRKVFRINNNCWSITTIQFVLEGHPDLAVTDLNFNKLDKEITLQPKDYVELYLEFQPVEPTAYTLYLPYIINNFIGPPVLNNPNSFKIGTYLKPPNMEISRQIPTLRVTCAAGAPWFKFSDLTLTFEGSNDEKKFEMTNVSSLPQTIKFVTENIDRCFSAKVDSCTGKYRIEEKFIKVFLLVDDTVVVSFKFETDAYGKYESDVPFYIKHYFDNCAFNYIKLRGMVCKPSFAVSSRTIMMPTIPVNRTFSKSVTVRLKNHKPSCSVSIQRNHDSLRTEMRYDRDAIEITVTVHPLHEGNIVTNMVMSCTCSASFTIYVRAACDNCSLLTYRHKMKCWKDPNDPASDPDNYALKLDKLNKLLETYIFSEGFFLTYYFKIPHTISRYPYTMYAIKVEQKPHKPRKEKIVHLPIVTLFKNLINASVVYHLTDGKNTASLDDRQGTAYDYSVYKNMLRFMEGYKVFVKNLNPELLLHYERYVIFKTMLIDEENLSGDHILSEEEFDALSRECWLDLLIKIYKLFHYDRLLKDVPPRTGKLEVDDIYSDEFRKYYTNNIESMPPDINECETKLMLWVEFHYNEQRNKLWPNHNLQHRNIRDLTCDLRDSLPLAAVMAAYCPYLSDIFKDIYFEKPDNAAHCPLHHNACLISEAWNRLNLSFKISTTSIFKPNNIEMLFILSYLYAVLPSFYPLETITIKSHLGKTSSAKVILKNPGLSTISYVPKLFLNDTESFHIECDHILIPSKGEKDLIVSYTAKHIIKEEAVLLVTGEDGGERFAKATAINLIGIPDILHFIQEIKVKVDLYETVTRTINIVSPYAQSYQANTYFYLFQEGKPPLTMNDFVSVTALSDLPRQLDLDGVCVFNETGVHKLTIKMCFVASGDWIYYIYFLNKDVGIFSVKIQIRAEPSPEMFETILVKVNTSFDPLAPCRCKPHAKNLLCSRILYVDIPNQNKDLLEGLRNMIKIYARKDEIDFWNTHLVFSKGIHIFRVYLDNTYNEDLVPFKQVLYPSVTYKLNKSNSQFSTDDVFYIDDTTSEGTQKLLIHWNSREMPKHEHLTLSAVHGLEIRDYKLQFLQRKALRNVKKLSENKIPSRQSSRIYKAILK